VIGLFIDCEGIVDCPPGGAVNPLSDGNDGDVGLAPGGRKPAGLLNVCELGLVRPDNEDGPVKPDSEFWPENPESELGLARSENPDNEFGLPANDCGGNTPLVAGGNQPGMDAPACCEAPRFLRLA
jgi:hypothetical protein